MPQPIGNLPRRDFLAAAAAWPAAVVAPAASLADPLQPQDPAQAEPDQVRRPWRIGLISAASYGAGGKERTSGSNHGTAFATIFNGWDEEHAPAYSGTFIKSPTRIAGAQVVKVWDPLPSAAQTMAAACRIPTVANSPEDCCADVDAVILIDDGSGRQWQYAEHPLKQGVPVFCDKPLAMTAREARRIAELAGRTGTKLMSASSLRFVPDIIRLRQQIDQIGPVQLAVATGPGELVYYGIHALSMVYSVLGGGVQSAHHVGRPGRHTVRLRYAHDLETLLLVAEPGQFPLGYQLQLYGQKGSLQVVPDLTDLYVHLLQAFIDYLATGVEPFPLADEVELIAALQAAEQSLALGREVRLEEMV